MPPESTTPASLRTGSRSGVFFSAVSPLESMTSSSSSAVLPASTASLTASLIILATVSMVPSRGFITALYAYSVPTVSAFESISAVTSSLAPFNAFEKPLKIWERITPELPLAPLSAPMDNAEATPSTVVGFVCLISATARCMVMDMFVPVSPSGTGKTFSESIVCLFCSSRAAPAKSIS